MTGKKVCISVSEETKNRLRAMGSKGDIYDDVIQGLIHLSGIMSDPALAKALAKESKMDDEFVKKLLAFHAELVKRGKRYRNCDYEAQKMLVRLDLLG